MTDSDVRDALRLVLDPEIGVNVVDLGLVYGIHIEGETVRVTMTMTSPTCPLRDYLCDQIVTVVRDRLPNVHDVAVEIVSDPPWSAERMSETARR